MKTKLLKSIRKEYYILDYPHGDEEMGESDPHFEIGKNHWLLGEHIRRWVSYFEYFDVPDDNIYHNNRQGAYKNALNALQRLIIKDNLRYGIRRNKIKKDKQIPVKVWYNVT